MVLVVIFFAGNILVGRAINDLPPFTIAFFRFLIAFVVLFPIGVQSAWENRFKFLEYRWPILVMALTGILFFNTFIYGALQFTTATNVAVLETIIPVVTVVLSAFMLKETLQNTQWIGIILSILGAVWVVLDGEIYQLASMNWNIGDVIMIGAIISWAVYSIYVKRYMHQFPTFAVLFVMLGIAVLFMFPVLLIEWVVQGIPSFNASSHVAGLLYVGILPSFIALIFYNRAVALLSPSQTSVFLNFLPVVTMIGAYLWLDETITVMQLIGALVVIGGVILTTQVNVKRKKVKDHFQGSNTSV